MKIIDTHAHYDDEAFDADRDLLLGEKLAAENVECVVNVGASLEGAESSARFALTHPDRRLDKDCCPAGAGDASAGSSGASDSSAGSSCVSDSSAASAGASDSSAGSSCVTVYAGIGIHPDDVGIFEGKASSSGILFSHPDDAMQHLRGLCSGKGVVCVGEIGLDYHWMVEEKEIQKKWFREQLRLAHELQLPVNVHSRDASQDTFDLIRENYASGHFTGGIIHCFSGSVELAREYVKMGYQIGIGGVVTFKNGKTLKKVAAEIPLEFLVTETDCPYLAPEPYRGKRNDSRYIRYVIEAIAQLKEMDPEDCAQALWKNACDVYQIKGGKQE